MIAIPAARGVYFSYTSQAPIETNVQSVSPCEGEHVGWGRDGINHIGKGGQGLCPLITADSRIRVMSFLKHINGGLTRELWPSHIGIPLNDHDSEKTLPAWKLMPDNFEDISAWGVVEPVASPVDGIERSMWIYHPTMKSSKTKVTVRIQGFVDAINIAPLGDWDGREQNAGGAMQSLALCGSGLNAPFAAQCESLEELRYAILCAVHHDAGSAVRMPAEDNIKLSRRVFRKISPLHRQEIHSALRPGDDPRGRAAKISHRWRVPFRIGVGVQHPDGKIVHAPQISIRKGDFVDVSFTPEIVCKRSRNGPQFEVKFEMQNIVRLFTRQEFSQDVVKLLQPVSHSAVATVVHDAESGFNFESEDVI
ncbi:hypothetical protein A0H81_12738 [Grifola frondosa]|uniref:Uncharacterized protein n=1 Tax=Grifola frondosa TaxID=5627 RepID=A0A1C7LX28_GRIFR|nr:hypothetical protein A0H81_12738 [Grifola frondosa]